jgi:hypothetical protein
MWLTYIHLWATDVFSRGPPRDYINVTEPNQVRQRERTRTRKRME